MYQIHLLKGKVIITVLAMDTMGKQHAYKNITNIPTLNTWDVSWILILEDVTFLYDIAKWISMPQTTVLFKMASVVLAMQN